LKNTVGEFSSATPSSSNSALGFGDRGGGGGRWFLNYECDSITSGPMIDRDLAIQIIVVSTD